MMKKTTGLRQIACAAVVFLAVMFLAAQGGHARSTKISPVNQQKVVVMTIQEVVPDFNFIFFGEQRFRVTPSATILDYRGNDIPLSRLPVPCQAEVSFVLFGDTRDPLIYSIRQR